MSVAIHEGVLPTSRLALYCLRNAHDQNRPHVLFLGGSNFDLRLKRSFLATPLVRDFNFATYEPRGIGRSEHPVGAWSMADYAADAVSVLDALEWPDAHIVGESFGGMTALHIASNAPERVKSLVIASATAGGPEHCSYDVSEFLRLSRGEAASASLRIQDVRNEKLARDNPAAFEKKRTARMDFERRFAKPSIVNGGYARLLDARRSHDCTTHLPRINAPTLVIAGKYDRQAAPEAQHALSEALPNAVFQMHEAGHGVLFALPQVARNVVGFLNRADVSVTRETSSLL